MSLLHHKQEMSNKSAEVMNEIVKDFRDKRKLFEFCSPYTTIEKKKWCVKVKLVKVLLIW